MERLPRNEKGEPIGKMDAGILRYVGNVTRYHEEIPDGYKHKSLAFEGEVDGHTEKEKTAAELKVISGIADKWAPLAEHGKPAYPMSDASHKVNFPPVTANSAAPPAALDNNVTVKAKVASTAQHLDWKAAETTGTFKTKEGYIKAKSADMTTAAGLLSAAQLSN